MSLDDKLAAAHAKATTDRAKANDVLFGVGHTSTNGKAGSTPTSDKEPTDTELRPFPVRTIGAMARAVDAMPPPRFLVRRLIVERDYGALGAERKFGKTFVVADLAVNVAAGGKFLGGYECDAQGPVLLFAGEGGERKIVRRARAVAAFYDLDHDELPLHVYERAPKLGNAEQVARFRLTVEQVRPVLVIVDPAYLALSGAETSNLASMGALLERAQHIAQDAGAGLLLSHHWNKTGAGTGVDRFTGAGFTEWARLLISGSTKSLKTDKITQATTAIAKLEIMGDEIAGTEITFRRRVWVDDIDDLSTPMHYEVELIDDDDLDGPDDELADYKPAARRVRAVLTVTGQWMDSRQIGDVLADDGHPLKKRTILEAAAILENGGLVERQSFAGNTPDLFRALIAGQNAP